MIGGTSDADNWDMTVDPKTATAMLDRAAGLVPGLSKANVLRHRVGLRPARPAVRCEAVHTATGQRVIHCYGHGGSGVTLSWGCADEVLELIRQA